MKKNRFKKVLAVILAASVTMSSSGIASAAEAPVIVSQEAQDAETTEPEQTEQDGFTDTDQYTSGSDTAFQENTASASSEMQQQEQDIPESGMPETDDTVIFSDDMSDGEMNASGEADIIYEEKRAEKDGYLYFVAENSSTLQNTDGLQISPVKVYYGKGDTILDAINRGLELSFTENFGDIVEDGRIFLGDQAYVATADTVVGALTLSDTVCPEEIQVLRLHQNTASKEMLDYFPSELQRLVAAMAEYREFATHQDPGEAQDAYAAAENGYVEAAKDPAKAQELADALNLAVENVKNPPASEENSETEEPAEVPEPESENSEASEEVSELIIDEETAGIEESAADQAADAIVTYPVQFSVKYGVTEIKGAKIEVQGSDGSVNVNTEGNYGFNLKADTYSYEVTVSEYETARGTFRVRQDQQGIQTVAVSMVPTSTVKYPVQFRLTCNGKAVEDAVLSVTNIETGGTAGRVPDQKYAYELPRGHYKYKISLDEQYLQDPPKFRPVYETVTGEFEVTKSTETLYIDKELKLVEYPEVIIKFGDREGIPSTGFKYYKTWEGDEPSDQSKPYDPDKTYTLLLPDYEYTGFAISCSGGPGTTIGSTITYKALSSGQQVTAEIPEGTSFYQFISLKDFVAPGKGQNHLNIEVKDSGEVIQTYSVDVIVINTLKGLSAEANDMPAAMVPAFSQNVSDYTVEVPFGTKSITFDPVPFQGASSGYQVTVNGAAAEDGKGVETVLNGETDEDIKIEVSNTAGGRNSVYTVHVKQVKEKTYRASMNVRTGILQESQEIDNAVIEIYNAEGIKIDPEKENGREFALYPGRYTYKISAEGYIPNPKEGTFEMGYEDRTVDVILAKADAVENEPLLKQLQAGSSIWSDPEGEFKRVDKQDVIPGIYEYWINVDMKNGVPYFRFVLSEEAAADKNTRIIAGYTHSKDGKTEIEVKNGELKSYLGNINYLTGNVFTLDVERGEKKEHYTIHLNRIPTVADISLLNNQVPQQLTPKFTDETTSYEVTIDQTVEELDVRAIVESYGSEDNGQVGIYMKPGTYTLTIDGVRLPDGVYNRKIKLQDLAEDSYKDVSVVIRDKATGNSETYTIRINKVHKDYVPMLGELYVQLYNGKGYLPEPELNFASDKYEYFIPSDSDMYSVNIRAKLLEEYQGGTVKFSFTDSNGKVWDVDHSQTVQSLGVIKDNGPDNTLTITATSPDGTKTQTYVLYFIRQSFLKTVTAYADDKIGESLNLAPSWSRTQSEYTILTPQDSKTVTLEAVPYSTTDDVMFLDGNPLQGAVTLPVDDTVHKLTVQRGEGGTDKVYTFHIEKFYTTLLDVTSGGERIPDPSSDKYFSIAVYDSNKELVNPNWDKTNANKIVGYRYYDLPNGEYTYNVYLQGYKRTQGSFKVEGKESTIPIDMPKYPEGKRNVAFKVLYNGTDVIENAELVVKTNSTSKTELKPTDKNKAIYELEDREGYYYCVKAPGCGMKEGSFDVAGENAEITIELEKAKGDIKGTSKTVNLTILGTDGEAVKDADGHEIINVPLTVDYFDLSQYNLHEYYWDDTYNEEKRKWEANENGAVNPNPTMLHLMLSAYEQLMGRKAVPGTADFSVEDVNESMQTGKHWASNVTAYWGTEGKIVYWFNKYRDTLPDENVYTKEVPDGADVVIQLYSGALGSGNYFTAMVPKENLESGESKAVIPQGTALDLSLRYSSSWNNGYLHNNPLKMNNLDFRKKNEDGTWTEWQRLEETTDSKAEISYFFEEPGIYQIRAGAPYSVSSLNKKGARVVRIPATITVEQTEQTPVDITFKVTNLDQDITDTAKIQIVNSRGEEQPLKTEGKPGAFSLLPGRYTYTVAAADGGYTRTGKFTVTTGQESKTYTVELQEVLFLENLRMAYGSGVDDWCGDFVYDPEKRGVFAYTGSVGDANTSVYMEASFKDEFADEIKDKTARLFVRYKNTSGVNQEIELKDGVKCALSGCIAKGMEDGSVKLFAETSKGTQEYDIKIKRAPTLKGLAARSGDLILTLNPEKFNANTLEYSTEVPADASEITLYPQYLGDGYDLSIENGKKNEDGGIKVRLNKDGDTKLSMTVSYQKSSDTTKTDGNVYTLNVKRIPNKESDPLVSMLGFYTGYGPSASDSVMFSLNKPFNPGVYKYNLTMTDCDSYAYVGLQLAEDAGEDVTVTAKFLNPTTGNYTATSIEPMKTPQSMYTFLYGFTDPGSDKVQVLNIEARKGDIVQTYIFRVFQNPKLNSLTVQEGDKSGNLTLTPGYNKYGDDKEFKAMVAPDAKSVKITANLSNNSFYDKEDGTPGKGYKLTVGETHVYANNTAVVIPLTGNKTRIPVVLEKTGKLPVRYEILIERMPDAAVSFTLDPSDASLLVADGEGNIISSTEEDSRKFILASDEEYTYYVSKGGYVGKTDKFIAENDKKIEITLRKAETNPDIDPDIESEWENFRGNENNNGITDVKTPISAEDAMLYWATKAGEGEAWENGAPGSPIIVGGYLYFNSGNFLYKMNKNTGEIVKKSEMVGSSSFSITPPTYAEGMIFVALAKGVIQAFNAANMESLWVYHDTLGSSLGANQPNSPITYHNGYIYTGFWNSEEAPAHMVCLSITDEDPENPLEEKLPSWVRSQTGGFYWAGAYASDNFVLVGTDDGTDSGKGDYSGNLLSLNPLTGAEIDIITGLDGDVRSTIMYDEETKSYYFTSKGGSFYGVQVNEDGTFVENSLKRIELTQGGELTMSTSTPVVYNGRAYIGYSGGGQFTMYDRHGIAVIDLASFSVAYTANTKGYPQTSGLLTTGYEGEAYVYFMDNYTPGTIRIIKDKPGQTALADPVTETYQNAGKTYTVENCAPVLFTPQGDHAQYSIGSPIVDENGTIYFKNDSGYIFALGNKIEKLELKKKPDKLLYMEGELFEPKGMQVMAVYTNGVEKDVTSLIKYPVEFLSSNQMEVILEYPYQLYNDAGTPDKLEIPVAIDVVADADMAKVQEAIRLISEIGEVTLESGDAIKAAREAYNKVPLLLINKVDNYIVLQEAEKKFAQLQNDSNMIKEFEDFVKSIGVVTLDKEDTIKEARALYNKMTDELKAKVEDSYKTLTNAEKVLAELKKQQQENDSQEAENKKKISEVEKLIKAIGKVTKKSGPAIQKARKAFDSLPESLKKRVSNYTTLLNAESEYAAILGNEQNNNNNNGSGSQNDPIRPGDTIGGNNNRPVQNGGGVSGGGTISGGNYSGGSGTVSGSRTNGSRNSGITSVTSGKISSGNGKEQKTELTMTGQGLPKDVKIVLTDVTDKEREDFQETLQENEKLIWAKRIQLMKDNKEVQLEGEVEISLWVGTMYDGQTLKVLQKNTEGGIAAFSGKVEKGYLKLKLSSLEPLAVAVNEEKDAEEPKTDQKEPAKKNSSESKKPLTVTDAGAEKEKAKTSDSGISMAVIIAVIVIAAASMGMVGYLLYKKKKEENAGNSEEENEE